MEVGDSLLGSVTHLECVTMLTTVVQRSRNVAASTGGTTHQSHRARITATLQ